MTSLPALLARLRLWPLLLLAAITTQAAAPIHAPLERVQGSAFSAATLDVALAAPRRLQGEPVQVAEPLVLPPSRAAGVVQRAWAEAAERPASPLPSRVRAPPPRRHPARLPDSTAPPLA
ncbi:hypothetical protein [Novosphingobium soli]|uniref:Uncharacterized protein n=1 Tax=Novosphingobium soli TaxID=574956 RepID=A0ABV6CUZ1_9SPHN